jgi:hypothetical protein
MQAPLQTAPGNVRIVCTALGKLANYLTEKETLYQTTLFRHGLYEFALLR